MSDELCPGCPGDPNETCCKPELRVKVWMDKQKADMSGQKTEQKTPELKPCPFCGGQPKRVSTSLSERFAYAQEVSYVCSCGCRRSARGDTSKGGYADNSKVEENALAAWNNRTQEAK